MGAGEASVAPLSEMSAPAEEVEQQKCTNKSVLSVQGDTDPGLFNPREWTRGQRRGRGAHRGPCCSSGSQSSAGGSSLGGWSRGGWAWGAGAPLLGGAVCRDPTFAPSTSEAAAGLWPFCISWMIRSNRSRSCFVPYHSSFVSVAPDAGPGTNTTKGPCPSLSPRQ